MIIQSRNLRSGLLLLALLLSFQVQAAGERLLIWKVKSAAAEMYLLGSMHLAHAAIYPLRSEIMEAFESSGKLVVEVDISGEKGLMVQQQMLQRGMFPPGQTLRDHVSAETWRLLEQQLPAAGLPLPVVQQMKPGLVATLLTVQRMLALGLSPEQGVDKFFLDRARGSKTVLELETVEQQIDLLINVPEADLFLRQTLSQLDSMEALLQPMVAAWKRGDAAALERIVLLDELEKNPEFAPILERLFDERNRDMAGHLGRYLQRGGRYFVVVGAGHLVGEQGIVTLLEKQGYHPVQL